MIDSNDSIALFIKIDPHCGRVAYGLLYFLRVTLLTFGFTCLQQQSLKNGREKRGRPSESFLIFTCYFTCLFSLIEFRSKIVDKFSQA